MDDFCSSADIIISCLAGQSLHWRVCKYAEIINSLTGLKPCILVSHDLIIAFPWNNLLKVAFSARRKAKRSWLTWGKLCWQHMSGRQSNSIHIPDNVGYLALIVLTIAGLSRAIWVLNGPTQLLEARHNAERPERSEGSWASWRASNNCEGSFKTHMTDKCHAICIITTHLCYIHMTKIARF